jgi:hypothetical protein
MPSIRDAAQKEGIGNAPISLRAFTQKYRVNSLKALFAGVTAHQKWEELGGPKSIYGLPLGDQINIIETPDGHVSQFRSGDLHIQNNVAIPGNFLSVEISLVGMECIVRQESVDEMYGVVTVIAGASNLIITKRFPASGTIEMGPDGMRIANISLDLLAGINAVVPVQNYHIWVNLVENDSGDVDDISSKIAEKTSSFARQAIGALTGIPAESVTDSESFKESLITGLKFLLGDIFGIGDDPYNSESIFLPWPGLRDGAFPDQPPVRRDDDNKEIKDWTHRVVLTGTDDGGDQGKYAIYLRVKVNQVTVGSNGLNP